MNAAIHTPTPRIEEYSNANAEHIVRCVNAYDDLLATVRFLAESAADPEFWADHGIERVRALCCSTLLKVGG